MVCAVLCGLVNNPLIRAQSSPQGGAQPSFEVASIKPNRSGDMRMGIRMMPGKFTATGMTTKQLIAFGYHVKDFQISGGASWISSDRYDIDAKEPDAFAE